MKPLKGKPMRFLSSVPYGRRFSPVPPTVRRGLNLLIFQRKRDLCRVREVWTGALRPFPLWGGLVGDSGYVSPIVEESLVRQKDFCFGVLLVVWRLESQRGDVGIRVRPLSFEGGRLRSRSPGPARRLHFV